MQRIRRTLLPNWLRKRTQYTLAYMTGLSQPTISMMLRSERRIWVVEEGDEVYLEEVRRIRPAGE